MEIVVSLNIKLEGDNVKNFKSALNKLNEENSRAGFKSSCLSPEEIKIIKDLSEKIGKE